jgi:hypothetical protein
MLRSLSILLLPAVLCLMSAAPAKAQWRGRSGPDIAGDYINRSNDGECSVYQRGRSYVFVNENGSRARFVFTGPRRLKMVAGEWNPSTVVTVLRGRRGPILRFQEANSRPGYWDPAD